jgi:hypothetical protein
MQIEKPAHALLRPGGWRMAMLLGVLDLIIRIIREVLDVVLFALLLMALVVAFESVHSARARAVRRRFRVHLGGLPSKEQAKKAA